MAGSQDPNDNPVAINVVPMVDVIFCLCVFFMCSFKFKQIQGKFDSWLPKDKGPNAVPAEIPIEIRVAMFWDPATEKVTRQLGTRKVVDDAELKKLIKEAHDDAIRNNRPKTPVTIDADSHIPWEEVINVVNIVKQNNIEEIEFALGAPPPKK